MHKIKGFKKKKKTKKNQKKGEEDLFDPEEFEKYKREKAAQAESGEAAGKDEEWEQFNALTAGVDSLLKQTQSDLDRIKTTSYFQRKKPPASSQTTPEVQKAPEKEKDSTPPVKTKRWIGFEEGSGGIDDKPPEEEEEEVAQPEQEASASSVLETAPEEPEFEEEEEDEIEEQDDIFDTSYVDAVASGEIKLAYIPDSPTEETTNFDPFDTSIVEKVIKPEDIEAINKKKKLVSLGCAVEVLTGKLERPVNTDVRARPRRKKEVNLLLESFDEDSANPPVPSETNTTTSPVKKTLLDDDPDIIIPESVTPLDLPLNLQSEDVIKPVSTPTSVHVEKDLTSVISEFDVITSLDTANEISHKEVIGITESVDDDVDDEFAALAAESAAKSRRESVNPEFETNTSDDPFNTSGVVVSLESKSIPTGFEEYTDEKHTTFPTSPDVDILLKGSNPDSWKQFINNTNTEQSNFSSTVVDNEINDEDIGADPFDTTFAENILPGKAELKLIESEILGAKEFNEAHILSQSDSDSDFNPREEEERVPVVSTVSIHITDPTGETQNSEDDVGITSLRPIHRDLLGGSTTDLSKLPQEPIEPKNIIQEENLIEEYIDPFDTSSVEVIVPGKVALKFIEKELLGEQSDTLKRSISDPDFNPRDCEDLQLQEGEASNKQVDVLQQTVSGDEQFAKPDLLNVNKSAAPQKVVAFKLPTPDLLAAGSDEVAHVSKPLTPYYADIKPESFFEKASENGLSESETDPFDTEFVGKLAPGKAELKIIECELVGETSGIKHSISDPDFNPRGEDIPSITVYSQPTDNIHPASINRRFSDFTGNRREKHTPPSSLPIRGVTAVTTLPAIPAEPTPSKPDLLVSEDNIPITAKPLTPAVETKGSLEYGDDFDPFDTSIASNLLPGKAELKVLENEFIVEGSSLKRSYTDPDFNPRDLNPNTAKTECPSEKPDILNLPSEEESITKPLSPFIEKGLEFSVENEEDIDPFDTSIASDLVPGKAELRVLESELIGQ